METLPSSLNVVPPTGAPSGAQSVEGALGTAASRQADAGEQTIRVGVGLLEHLMTAVSELVLTRNQLMQVARARNDMELLAPLQNLSLVTSEIQEGIMKTRMQPIGDAWAALPRLVRDVALQHSKKIDLQMIGAETELDRQVLEKLKGSLAELVRSAAESGIEPTVERLSAGKPETGRIALNAYQEGGHIVIEVSDDGRGADLERWNVSDVQCLDLARAGIGQLGGGLELRTREGSGSSVLIKIPLTLAIASALIVESAGERFAIPQATVLELVRAAPGSDHRVEKIHDAPVLRLRNQLLPLISLSRLLELNRQATKPEPTEEFVVVLQVGAASFGVLVDRVFDTEEIVVKPTAPLLRHLSMFSGNTILGDGCVIMILDPTGLLRSIGEAAAHTEEDAPPALAKAASTDSLLLFRAGFGAQKAVPLASISRLEMVATASIENSEGRLVVQYRGALMPLVPANPTMTLAVSGAQPVLVIEEADRSVGVLVDEIVDIVECDAKTDLDGSSSEILGVAIVAGKATELLDVKTLLTKAVSPSNLLLAA